MQRGTVIARRENPAKELLRGYISMLARRDALQREIDERYERAGSTTTRLRPINVQGGGSVYDRMAEDVCGAQDAKRQLQAKMEEINARLAHILAAIEALSDERQKTVLTLRYIRGMRWEGIERQMHYERTQIYVLHGRALVRVNEWMRESNS